MMKMNLRWWPRSVASRLMAIAVVPTAAMLLIVNAALYVAARAEVDAEVAERGRLLAASLAEGSAYAVVSGNLQVVEQTARGLAAVDPGLSAVRLLDGDRLMLLEVDARTAAEPTKVFESPIVGGTLAVDLFDTTAGPHVSAEQTGRAKTPHPQILGFVEVRMSSAPMLEMRRERLIRGNLIVLAAALVAAGMGLWLVRQLRRPLDQIVGALRRIRRGENDVRFDPTSSGEIGELQSAITEMARALGASRQALEAQVAERTRELQAAVERATAADAEKRRLLARGNELVEDERRRISLEIHDDLNAALVSMKLQMAALIDALAAEGDAPRSPDLLPAARRIAQRVDELYARARDIVKQLRPEVLDTLGLSGAIAELVGKVGAEHPGCRFEFTADTALPPIDERTSMALYRVAQEALTNVVKHARATWCQVRLAEAEDATSIELGVEDNGVGLDTARSDGQGLGIAGMRERVSALGGTLRIHHAGRNGVAVVARVPLGVKH